MNLNEPMFIIGASMGGAIVSMFTVKYPTYVRLMGLLAPPGDESCETSLIKELRQGKYQVLLPESSEQLRDMIDTQTVKQIYFPQVFLNGFFHLRLALHEEHKKVLSSLLEHDYPNLEKQYQQLTQITCPTLILWGQQDKLYTSEGAQYFSKLIKNSETIIVENCGHFMAIDKPEEVAQYIRGFLNKHCTN